MRCVCLSAILHARQSESNASYQKVGAPVAPDGGAPGAGPQHAYMTPLESAVGASQLEAVLLLLERGAVAMVRFHGTPGALQLLARLYIVVRAPSCTSTSRVAHGQCPHVLARRLCEGGARPGEAA